MGTILWKMSTGNLQGKKKTNNKVVLPILTASLSISAVSVLRTCLTNRLIGRRRKNPRPRKAKPINRFTIRGTKTIIEPVESRTPTKQTPVITSPRRFKALRLYNFKFITENIFIKCRTKWLILTADRKTQLEIFIYLIC